MKLGSKIICGVLAAITITVAVTLLVQRFIIHRQGVDLTIETMRTAIVEAENVRESISFLGEHGAFDRAKLLAEYRATGNLRESTLYRTIPVVAAWEAIQKAAAQSGFEFRVPKHQARNPQNNPTPAEADILREFESGTLPEYIRVDPAANLIVYARPIKLTQDCLSCHGDPATSPTRNGKDILGFPMENWRVGEVHGAFVLTSSLDRVDAVVRRGMLQSLAWVLPLAAVIGLVFYVFNRRVIVRPLRLSIDRIEGASLETGAISAQITSASQSLAEGASEQAASLEAASASLEEMASMTRRNADHARQAKQTATLARTTADTGSGHMQQMEGAMQSIESANQDITKILQTIDEIAFQTNILALNAAVEAARAGEAGAGFAVVADEVRALAQRCAAAAKETAAKIEDCVQKSHHGVRISTEVARNFAQIQQQVQQLDHLVAEITTASDEQSTGINQINAAVAEMDKVTQANAGNAEETAAATNLLSAQTQALNDAVISLQALTGAVSGAGSAAGVPPAPAGSWPNGSQPHLSSSRSICSAPRADHPTSLSMGQR